MKLTARQKEIVKKMRAGCSLIMGETDYTRKIFFNLSGEGENLEIRYDVIGRMIDTGLIRFNYKGDYVLADWLKT